MSDFPDYEAALREHEESRSPLISGAQCDDELWAVEVLVKAALGDEPLYRRATDAEWASEWDWISPGTFPADWVILYDTGGYIRGAMIPVWPKEDNDDGGGEV